MPISDSFSIGDNVESKCGGECVRKFGEIPVFTKKKSSQRSWRPDGNRSSDRLGVEKLLEVFVDKSVRTPY